MVVVKLLVEVKCELVINSGFVMGMVSVLEILVELMVVGLLVGLVVVGLLEG